MIIYTFQSVVQRNGNDSLNFNELEGEQQAAKFQFLASTGLIIAIVFAVLSATGCFVGFLYWIMMRIRE
ncbi:hypothetical protein niasHS_007698 [Heterodera schachtii]|uniref:Uncharacterized protein n=1 Tax=Heterodera schachtii TaxID=97005 RepID=A0ABD2JPE8_HETSC